MLKTKRILLFLLLLMIIAGTMTGWQSACEVNICWWTTQMHLSGKFLRQQVLPMWLLFDKFGIHCKFRYARCIRCSHVDWHSFGGIQHIYKG